MGKGKRIIGIILLICALCFLGGCKETSGTPAPTEKPYYEFQGVRVGTEFSKAQAVFGAYENRVPEETQTTYFYPHFMVITGMQGNKEIVTSIMLRSSAFDTEEGVVIGDTRETVLEKQGEDYTEDSLQGQMIYVKKDTVLTFLVDAEGVVLSITYSLIAEE